MSSRGLPFRWRLYCPVSQGLRASCCFAMLAPRCHFASSSSIFRSFNSTDPTSKWCLRIFPGPAVESVPNLRLAAQCLICTPMAIRRASIFHLYSNSFFLVRRTSNIIITSTFLSQNLDCGLFLQLIQSANCYSLTAWLSPMARSALGQLPRRC